jgi:hypothetical protein
MMRKISSSIGSWGFTLERLVPLLVNYIIKVEKMSVKNDLYIIEPILYDIEIYISYDVNIIIIIMILQYFT